MIQANQCRPYSFARAETPEGTLGQPQRKSVAHQYFRNVFERRITDGLKVLYQPPI